MRTMVNYEDCTDSFPRAVCLDGGWRFQYGPFMLGDELSGKNTARTVNLPHDYMLEDGVSPDAPSAAAMGYYNGRVAYYAKTLQIPADWKEEKVYLHFDGIMMNAALEINGCQVLLHHYGYTPFWADITPYVYWGEANRITVSVNPSMQPNSRWYTGAGIFRSVELVHTPRLHVAADGIFTYTKRIEYEESKPSEAYLCTEVTVCNDTPVTRLAQVEVSLIPLGKTTDNTLHGLSAFPDEPVLTRSVRVQVNAMDIATAILPMTLPSPMLWNVDDPNLYQVSARVMDLGELRCGLVSARDVAGNATGDAADDGSADGSFLKADDLSVLFGIRTLSADSTHGLKVNGQTVKLKGGCIHHDNGILGAVSLYDSEYRRIRLLKDAGFNAVRTSHNPPSAVLLEVCDRLGMYVFDEAFDAWGMAKQPGDYNQFFKNHWKDDMKAFILRDRNHPSILFWSTGNEIPERGGMNDGYRFAMELAAYVRSFDSTRLVSNGLCSYWNGLDDRTATANFLKMKELSENATGMEQNASAPVTDTFWEDRSEPFCSFLDVVGYNYMEDHYELAGKMFPERVILGTESFPMEIDRVWDYVERLPYVIGDCTWTAFDYIGEAGIGKSIFVDPGSPEADLEPWALMSHSSEYPWRLANDADFDINGNLTPQGIYRRIVWGSRETGLFAASPDTFGKKEIISKWGWPALAANWSWKGQEGRPIRVTAYSAAEEVELFLNGESLGKCAAGKANRYMASFDITYQPGLLEAVSYQDGAEVSRTNLKTTGEPAAIRLIPEPLRGADASNVSDAGTDTSTENTGNTMASLTSDGHSLSYIAVEIVDAEGNRVMDSAVPLKASVTGAGTLAGFGSANPITEENYTTGSFTTYQGRALAVIRSGYETGEVCLTISADPDASVHLEEAVVKISVL